MSNSGLIQVLRPYTGAIDEEIEAVSAVLRSGWWGMGLVTEQLEREFAATVGAPYAVAVNSCTAALHLALLVAGVGPGDEVIVPSLTFVSTAHAVLYAGARPVFADVEQGSLCIDPADVARKITNHTRAIIPVHYAGLPADMDRLQAVAGNITIIEDAAHAAGAAIGERMIGNISPLTCFSFHPLKNIACGDGGMITLRDADMAERLRHLRWCGIDKSTWQRQDGITGYRWHYNVDELGYKYHLNDIQAAIALIQLRRLEQTNARRRAIAARYDYSLDFSQVERRAIRPDMTSAHHLYVIRLEGAADLARYMQQEWGIGTGVHYYPVHLFDMYASYRCSLPVTEREWQRLISLPLHPGLTDRDVDRVIHAVNAFERVTV